MSSASVPPYGFAIVRRGYRPDQVDTCAAELSRDRDVAWERAARLTVLAREMEAEALRLRETVAQLAPQTYEALGERARQLFELVQEEAAAVGEAGRREAEQAVGEAEEEARRVREAAQAYADEVGAEAEERVRTRLLAARAEADDMRVAARREVKEGRGEAVAALREVRQRTEGLLGEREKEYAERWERVLAEAAEREAALQAHEAEAVARAEAGLVEAERELAGVGESARECLRAAEERAAELVERAREREERIASETERVLQEHAEQRAHVRAHMDNVRASLTTLTGRAPAE